MRMSHAAKIGLGLGLGLGACEAAPSPRQLDHGSIQVVPGARVRTDRIGDGEFAETATFVLVDADNAGSDGAYVTLGGELSDEAGAQLGVLKPQSLWIPAGGTRTFALVDDQRKPRPGVAHARFVVRGALTGEPPLAHVDHVREIPDDRKIVLQGSLVNDADREGTAVVIAAFHDAQGMLMTRPYSLVALHPHGTDPIQFVGPYGSTHGTLFVGDLVY